MSETGKLREQGLMAIATEVARQLAHVHQHTDGVFISLPLLYSSGAHVVVRVSVGSEGNFAVSDMGGGYQEASLTGADAHYVRAANAVAAKAGIRSDGRVLSDSDIARDQLVAAVTVVGNCSLEAWSLAEHRNRERKRQDSANEFFLRMFKIVKSKQPFAKVERNVSVRGNSQSEWDFDVEIKVKDERSLFEFVSPHPQSVAFATTKCSDVGRIADPPTLVCVVDDRKALGARLGWLLPVANVIESTATPEPTLLRLAHAA